MAGLILLPNDDFALSFFSISKSVLPFLLFRAIDCEMETCARSDFTARHVVCSFHHLVFFFITKTPSSLLLLVFLGPGSEKMLFSLTECL